VLCLNKKSLPKMKKAIGRGLFRPADGLGNLNFRAFRRGRLR
jgi:hypothetical protein